MSAAKTAADTVVADVAVPAAAQGVEVVEVVFDIAKQASTGRKFLYAGLAAVAIAATAGAVVWTVGKMKGKIEITNVADVDAAKEAAENVASK